jgi:hypothetical protein
MFWVFSVVVSAYALYLLANWRRQPASYALLGLLGFPGLLIGAVLIFAARGRRRPEAADPGQTPERAPTPLPVSSRPSVPAAPAPAATDERQKAVQEAERILNSRPTSRKSRKPEPKDDRFAALNALREYHDLGLMSDAEFDAKRKEILFRL